jgi:hypothetical protein
MAHMVSDLYTQRYRADPQSRVSLLARRTVSQKEPTSSLSRLWEMVVLVPRQTCQYSFLMLLSCADPAVSLV